MDVESSRITVSPFNLHHTASCSQHIRVYVCRQNLIHLDMKPENVLLTGDALDVRIADLGLATLTTDEGTAQQTHGGGTMGYCAPEVASKTFSAKADIYSIAVTYFDMAAGRQEAGRPTLPRMDTDDPCAPLRECESEESRRTCELLVFALRLKSADRPSASELVAKIRALRSRGSSTLSTRSDITLRSADEENVAAPEKKRSTLPQHEYGIGDEQNVAAPEKKRSTLPRIPLPQCTAKRTFCGSCCCSGIMFCVWISMLGIETDHCNTDGEVSWQFDTMSGGAPFRRTLFSTVDGVVEELESYSTEACFFPTPAPTYNGGSASTSSTGVARRLFDARRLDGCTSSADGAADRSGDRCGMYLRNTGWCGNYDDSDFSSNEMCCACGGGSDGLAPTGAPCYEFAMQGGSCGFLYDDDDDDYDDIDDDRTGWHGGQTYIIREVPNGTVSNVNAIVASGALMEGHQGTDVICLDVGCYTLEVTSDANYVDWEYQVVQVAIPASAALMLVCLVICCCCFCNQLFDRHAAGVTATAPSGEVLSTEMRVNYPVRMNTSFVSASEERPSSCTPSMVVTIPPGAVPGMTIEARTPAGHVLMVPVSHGMAPGTAIQVNYSGARVDSISSPTSGVMGDPRPEAPAQQSMVVTVPHGMGPGRAIQVQTPTGQVMMVTVPHFMGPGGVMRVNY